MHLKYLPFILLSSYVTANALVNDFFLKEKEGYFYYKDGNKKDQKKVSLSELQKKQKFVTTTNPLKNNVDDTTLSKMLKPFENKEERRQRKILEAEYIKNLPLDDLDNLSADEYRRMLDATRDIAVATPKKDYVRAYQTIQKFWVDKSEKFAKVWQVAAIEDADKLTYPDFETSLAGRRVRSSLEDEKNKKFFKKIKSRLGYIVIVDSINKNSKAYNMITNVYEMIKKEEGIEYIIYEYSQVPSLVRKLKLDPKILPDNFFLYKGNEGKPIYKRVAKGFPTVSKIISNTKFMFENGILEKNKDKRDRLKGYLENE